jgi:hypothetical protein
MPFTALCKGLGSHRLIFLKPLGHENSQVPLHTPASTHTSTISLPIVLLVPEEWGIEKKRRRKEKKRKD